MLGLGISVDAVGRRRFSPAHLFTGGAQGLFLDPSNLSALFQDAAGTLPVASPGDPVALVLDRSGNLTHAVQGVNDDFRPTLARHPLGGIRQLLNSSSDLTAASWGKTNMQVDGAAVTDTGGVTYDRLRPDGTGVHHVEQFLPQALGGYVTLRQRVRLESAVDKMTFFPSGSGAFAHFDLTNQTTSRELNVESATITDLGDGSLELTAVWPGAATTSNRMRIYASSGANGNGSTTEEGSIGVLVARSQFEQGAIATAPQTRLSAFDTIEPGKPDIWHLSNDQYDDGMTATLPDLGANATEFWADEIGVTITGALTIGAGARDLPGGARLYAYGLIDRALSPSETSKLTAYLDQKRGAQ